MVDKAEYKRFEAFVPLHDSPESFCKAALAAGCSRIVAVVLLRDRYGCGFEKCVTVLEDCCRIKQARTDS